MKHSVVWFFLASCLVLSMVVVSDVAAQSICWTCVNWYAGPPEGCMQAAHQQEGNTGCEFDGLLCRYTGGVCSSYCPDQNNNGECDHMEEQGCPPSVCGSPVVIGQNGRYAFTSVADGVRFDVNEDGVREQTAWTAPGSGVGFLVVDRDNDGLITSGRELFGNKTAPRVPNGFEMLGTMDLDGNDVLDHQDSTWARLALWVDADHDGITDEGELMPISETDIEGISTVYHRTDRKDKDGNLYRYRSVAWRDGHAVPTWDVFLRSQP